MTQKEGDGQSSQEDGSLIPEIKSWEELRRVIDEQAEERMPETGLRPFAYVGISTDGGASYELAQVVWRGEKPTSLPYYLAKIRDRATGEPLPDSEQTPRRVGFISEKWMQNPDHKMRVSSPVSAIGQVFPDGAERDLTIVSPQELQSERERITQMRDSNPGQVMVRAAHLSRLSRAYARHGYYGAAAETADMIPLRIRDKKLSGDIQNIQAKRRQRGLDHGIRPK